MRVTDTSPRVRAEPSAGFAEKIAACHVGLEVIGKVMGASWKEHGVKHHEIPF